jgi:hypothetical protein
MMSAGIHLFCGRKDKVKKGGEKYMTWEMFVMGLVVVVILQAMVR